jgi:chromosome segregation protein
VHLKSLTLKGFKSFASATTLRLEPGITCVVGPNGSGKSNVVDAISWVLGEQGAKALRGGKMEDVIFAGTSGRAPLGRAEVTLTIDNADGALPIDYAEVSITRRMFRDGAGEYEINGSQCRLLDIQELLSDSGIGREMHVIVGQGQLDSVLSSKPEDRRAYIEEAAGVLKHRKRKEKALRKLDAMQANLTRLTDLTAELRRQLKPLGRQAEIARRAQAVQSELRDARLRLAADDLVTLRDELAKEEADEASARARRAEVEAQLSAGRVEQERLEAALAEDAPRLAAAQDTWYRLSALAERLAGTVRLAQERARHLAATTEARAQGRDPDQLDAEADAIAEQEEELVAGVVEARRLLSEITEARTEHERTLAAAEREHRAAVRALADRRAGLATLAGRAEALRSGAAATAEEIERLSDALVEAQERAAAAEADLAGAREELTALADGDASLEERSAHAGSAHETARARVAELVAREREAERQRAHWRARVEALSVGLARRDGSAALAAAEGVLGTVSALVTVDADARTAVAAALGELADGLAVADLDAALAALGALRTGAAGRASLVVAGLCAHDPGGDLPLPDVPGARWAASAVVGYGPFAGAVRALLHGIVLVDGPDAARRVVAAGLTAVTADGDVVGPHRATGGSGAESSALDVQAAVDEATTELAKVEDEIAGLHPALDGARAEEAARKTDVEASRREQGAAEQRRAGAAARLGAYEQAVRSATGEAQRLRTRRDEVETRRSDALLALEAAERQLAVAEDEPVADEPDTEIRDAAAEAVETARSAEVEARLALRTAEERARAIAGRADSLRRQASAERQARSRAAAARAARERGARVAALVVEAGEKACGRIAVSLSAAAEERDAAATARDSRERELGEARLVVGRLAALMEKLTDAVHRDEVLRAQNRLRLEQLTEKVLADHGLGADDLVAEYGPDVPVPASAAETAEFEAARERGEEVTAPPAMPYDRPTQQRRAQRAEKDLTLLGKVNPLALEEFAALEERYRFLSTQLEDLKNTRRDLLTVVREVDDKILEVFTEAYEDVAREFVTVFATLFPGGEGRLVLTDPEDMLTTGIEVEARPPGKKVKRLSLLSGGERSLTAMALLVAIFRARPSPFYVLDEIEAALDDVNLRRLILLMEELRETSQLIVITHQKPTMEVADALYGVSMRGDGITTVISQRLRPAS